MKNIYIENYGCQMNVAEVDSLINLFIENNFSIVDTPEEANFIIINTCAVRNSSEERVCGRISELAPLCKKNKISIILTGCMSYNTGLTLKNKYPEVIKALWGNYNKDRIIDLIKNEIYSDNLEINPDKYHFLRSSPQGKYPFKSFIPISHGCNNFCAYCIVPYVRGPEIYRDFNNIKEEIIRLIDRGVVEFTLLGQNVNSYRSNNLNFCDLLDKLANINGVKRLSFLTSHPKDFNIELINVIKQHNNIQKYIHLPLQSGSNKILNLMNRKYTKERYLELIDEIKKIEDIVITTDILVGFPGETEEDFKETLETIINIRFDEAFMYYYNERKGTVAERLENKVSIEDKLKRLNKLISIQNKITKENLQKRINKTYEVLIENISKKNKNEFSGRSENNLLVYFENTKNHKIGEFVKVKTTEPSGMGLKGHII